MSSRFLCPVQGGSRALTMLQTWLENAGVTDPSGLDLMRAMLLGLAGEQIANEPEGLPSIGQSSDAEGKTQCLRSPERSTT